MSFQSIFSQSKVLRYLLMALIAVCIASSLFVRMDSDPFKIVIVVLMFLCAAAFCGFIFEMSHIPLLLVVIGTLAFGRSFSLVHFQVKGIPLYITEIAIGASLAFLVLKGTKYLNRFSAPVPKGLIVPLLVYFFLGLMYTVIGIRGNGSAAFRDITFCLYLVILFITFNVFETTQRIKAFLIYLLPAVGVLLFIAFILFFVFVPGGTIYRLIVDELKMTNIGLYCGFITIFGLGFFTFFQKKSHRYLIAIMIYLAFLFVLMAEVRAAWAGLLVTMILLGILLKKQFLVFFVFLALMVASLFIIDHFGLGVQDRKLASMAEKLTFDAKKSQATMASANIQFRIRLWKHTIKEIQEYPVFGWGYGTQIDYVIWGQNLYWLRANDPRMNLVPPHNHLLAITYKMGFVGLLLFLLINGWVFLYGILNVKRCQTPFSRRFLISCLGSLVYWHGMAFFFDILESPPTSIFLWVIIGGILTIIHQEKQLTANERQ
jgi:O-antigen ligase